MNQQEFSKRPENFDEFVGQKKLKKTLKIMINSSRIQNVPLDHILFYGPPGLGKTSLAKIIGNESSRTVHFAQGTLIEKKSDILLLFSSIKENDIVFIDEIHAIGKSLDELLYTAMEDFIIDIPIGVDGDKKIMRMKLKPFTLIGATTKINLISSPLKDRFGLLGKMNFYNITEIKQIIKNYAAKLNYQITNLACDLIAENSKFTPRICLNFLKRSQDFAINAGSKQIDHIHVKKMFHNLSIYKLGLNSSQINYLTCLYKIFNKKFASIDAIASIISEDKFTIISNIESDLILLKLIEKSARGRIISEKGIKYLNENNFIKKSR